MSRERKKRLGMLLLVGALAIPLAIVSTAWACGRLANLNLDKRSAKANAAVSGVGLNYNSGPTSSEVTVRLRSRTGPVLWTGRPNADGTITPSFNAPSRPGYYTILATQRLANGAPAAGTPGRAVLKVRRKARSSRRGEIVPSPWATPTAPGGGPSGGAQAVADRPLDVPPAAAVGGGLAFLVLSGGGVMLLRGSRRTRTA